MRLSWKDFLEKRAQSVIGPAWGGTWGIYWPRSNGSSGQPAPKPQAPAQVREFELPENVKYFFDEIKHGIDPDRYPTGFYNYPNLTHKEDEENNGSYAPTIRSDVRPTLNLSKTRYPNLSDPSESMNVWGTTSHELQHDIHHRMAKKLTDKQIAMLRLAYPHAIEGIKRVYAKKGIRPDSPEMVDLINNELEAINANHQIRLMEDLGKQLGRRPTSEEFRKRTASLSYPEANGYLLRGMSGYEDRNGMSRYGFLTGDLETARKDKEDQDKWVDSLDERDGRPDQRRRDFFLKESPVYQMYLERIRKLEEQLKKEEGKESLDAYKWTMGNVKYSPRPTGWHRMI